MKKIDINKFKNRNAVLLKEVSGNIEDLLEIIDLSSNESFPPLHIQSNEAWKFTSTNIEKIKDELYTQNYSDLKSTTAFKKFSGIYKGIFEVSKKSLQNIYIKNEKILFSEIKEIEIPTVDENLDEVDTIFPIMSHKNVVLVSDDKKDSISCYLIAGITDFHIGSLLFYPNKKSSSSSYQKTSIVIPRQNKQREILSMTIQTLKEAIESKNTSHLLAGKSFNKSRLSDLVVDKSIDTFEPGPELNLPRGLTKENIRKVISQALDFKR